MSADSGFMLKRKYYDRLISTVSPSGKMNPARPQLGISFFFSETSVDIFDMLDIFDI